MMNPHVRVARLVVATLAILAASMALAQAPAVDPSAIQGVVEEAKAQLKPLVQDRNQKLKAIRDKYAGQSSRRAKRAMFKEAQPVVENYQARVRTILNDEQEAEWEKMRAEAKERFKEQYKSSNGPQ